MKNGLSYNLPTDHFSELFCLNSLLKEESLLVSTLNIWALYS